MRRIAAVTTSRADFAHLRWPLHAIEKHPDLALDVIAGAAHMSPEFGDTIREVEADGFAVRRTFESLLSSDSDTGMAKSIGVAVLSLADILADLRPDILLLIADRYEMLAPASVAVALRIPIAHIEGGDISQGAIDDAIRNALTKLSHLHFTTNTDSHRRVLAMGEEAWRITQTGSPSLDILRERELPDAKALKMKTGFDAGTPYAVIATHPVTLLHDTTAEADALFAVLDTIKMPVAFAFPNADAGSRALINRVREFCSQHENAKVFTNLDQAHYFALLRDAAVMLGNSSSGVMESASFGLPTIDIGDRQAGRLKPANVIECPADVNSIRKALGRALSEPFRAGIKNMQNPYGDGQAGERIAQALAAAPDRDALLRKAPPVETENRQRDAV